MTNKEKLKSVISLLTENKIVYYPHYNGGVKVTPDLYIPKHKIMIKISEGTENDNQFFKKVKHKYHPLFIRDIETEEFVLEKIQNLIIDVMKKKQVLHNKNMERRKRNG